MSALCTFAFDEQPVRVIMREDDPWFVAADVCRALAIANNRDAIARLDADERGVALTDTPGGQQNVGIINESGLYTLILRCDDAIKSGTRAHRFRKWVTSEVLPAIRSTGQFHAMQSSPLQAVRELLITSARDVRDKKLDVGRAQQIANLAARYLEAIKLEGDVLGYETVLGLQAGKAAGRILPNETQLLQAVPQPAVPRATAGERSEATEELRDEEALGGGEPAATPQASGEGDLR